MKLDNYQIITPGFLDLRDENLERNSKLVEDSKIEEVKLFKDFDPRLVRIGKILPGRFQAGANCTSQEIL